MAGQPTVFTGYWPATALAAFLVQPIVGSYLVTGSSFPVDLQIFQEMIDEKSSEFDQAAARGGYQTPIPSTATQGFSTAKRVTRDGAIADALRQVYTGPDPKYADRYETAFQNALKLIASGDRLLPGAPSDTSSGAPMPAWSGVASPLISASMGAGGMLGIPRDF